MRRVETNGEHNKKGSPEVNRVRSSTRSMIWGLGTLPELQEYRSWLGVTTITLGSNQAMQLFLLLIRHQVTHSTDAPQSHRGNCRSIIGEHSYCSVIWLSPTSTWFVSYSFYFLFNPSFLVITHLVLFLVYLLMNPYPYFKFPYQSYPYVSLLFPFLYSRLTYFVTSLSQHNRIILALYCVICSLEKWI